MLNANSDQFQSPPTTSCVFVRLLKNQDNKNHSRRKKKNIESKSRNKKIFGLNSVFCQELFHGANGMKTVLLY